MRIVCQIRLLRSSPIRVHYSLLQWKILFSVHFSIFNRRKKADNIFRKYKVVEKKRFIQLFWKILAICVSWCLFTSLSIANISMSQCYLIWALTAQDQGSDWNQSKTEVAPMKGNALWVYILRDFKNAPFYILSLFHMIDLRMFSVSFFILLPNGPWFAII